VSETIHASCVVVGEAGILIRGPSGSGKSALARALIDLAHERGLFARLVGDDRIVLKQQGGRLVARPVATIQGLMEVRGQGIAQIAHEGAAVVRLVIDCLRQSPPRYPDDSDRMVVVSRVELPHMSIREGGDAASIVLNKLTFMHQPAYSTIVP
jgi:serine kinase of HPr protein (carbohydrate metabolism regulator)